MNEQMPTPPLNVPVLTEVIDAEVSPPPVDVPVLVAEVPTLLDEPSAVTRNLSQPGELPSYDEVPRNLLRGAGASDAPPPMRAAVAAPLHATGGTSLEAARASLSEALRSARDGRWAPMPNVEAPVLTAPLLETPAAPEQPEQPGHPAVPTLDELVEAAPVEIAVPEGPIEVTEVSEAQLAHRVLSVVNKQIDGLIEFRLREAMGPILQRHTDALVRDLRDELKQTMQDVVSRAVAQEMAKVRPR